MRYKGAKTSRKDLYEDESDDIEDQDKEMDSLSSDEEEEDRAFESSSEADGDSDNQNDDGDDSEEQNDDEDDDNIEIEASGADDKHDKLKALLSNEQKTLSSQLSSIALTDSQKGESIQNQMVIYESILDARIKLQKGLAVSNTMPLSKEKAEQFKDESTDSKIKNLKSSLYDLLDQLTTVRLDMMKSDGLDVSNIKVGKKRALEAAMANANRLEDTLTPYRDAVLTKWSRKIQAASGASALNQSKFSIQNQNAKLQVTTNLADMDRLVKRTRINRSNYVVLGEEEQESDKKNVDSNLQERIEIFDDTDFYRLLLKDLVDRRMADAGTSTGMKWTVVKPKVKKNVDTKASKGRKLRYHVQEKIQNFDAPRQFVSWSDDQIDELFAGLFGQKVEVNEEEEIEKEAEEEIVVNDGLKIFG